LKIDLTQRINKVETAFKLFDFMIDKEKHGGPFKNIENIVPLVVSHKTS
jgi:hypothetical protein